MKSGIKHIAWAFFFISKIQNLNLLTSTKNFFYLLQLIWAQIFKAKEKSIKCEKLHCQTILWGGEFSKSVRMSVSNWLEILKRRHLTFRKLIHGKTDGGAAMSRHTTRFYERIRSLNDARFISTYNTISLFVDMRCKPKTIKRFKTIFLKI